MAKIIGKSLNTLDLINKYNSGLSCEEIAKMYNTTSQTVLYRLKKENFVLRDFKENLKSCLLRKAKSVNPFAFSDIDTKEKAYWLGFLYADGCISNRGVSLSLKESDVKTLQDFKTFLNSTHKISYRNKTKSVGISISSWKLVEDLKNLGLYGNKAYRLVLPVLEEDLYSHFIRGVFDGDGCISKNKKSQFYFSIVSCTKDFLEKIKQLITTNCKTNPLIKIINSKYGNWKSLVYGGNKQVKRILDWVYYDSNELTRLERKYSLYVSLNKLQTSQI